MSKNIKWIAIFGAMILICVAVIFFGQFSGGTVSAEVYVDGKLYTVVKNLDRQRLQSIRVETEHGCNIICYEAGKIWVEDTDCANQTCKKYGKASLVGETIVCAPHKLVIKIVSSSSGDVDAIT